MTVPPAGTATLVGFGVYMAAVFVIGLLSHRLLSRGNFVQEFFLGNRGLGAWTLALTVAATAISGGSMIGFPSLVYSNGWSGALWIAGYMMVPIVCMGLFGKRMNQVSRALGSITVPDVLRDRFGSRALGLISTVAIIFFLTVNMVAQFKGGGLIMEAALGPALTDLFGVEKEDMYTWGVIIVAVTVVGYTAYGGFWAVTFTDLLEGTVKLMGAVLLLPLVIHMAGGLGAATTKLAEIDPQLVYLPGPGGFLPLSLAASFFLYWPLVGAGQPSGMVRLMSFKDTASLRKALIVVTGYYVLVYVPLILIFTCARSIFPTEYVGDSDRIMPVMVLTAAPAWMTGILLAAPFAAIMSTVAAFLLMISSGLVRDIWQRNVNPDMSPAAAKTASVTVTAVAGIVVTVAALKPPTFLQYIILFTGGGLASGFLVPMVLALYWPKMTRAAALASMVGGFAAHVALWGCGFLGMESATTGLQTKFKPYYLLGLDPAIWGMIVSLVAAVAVARFSAPPPSDVVQRLFGDRAAKPSPPPG